MNLKRLICRQTIDNLSRINGTTISSRPYATPKYISTFTPSCLLESEPLQNPKPPKSHSLFSRSFHCTPVNRMSTKLFGDPNLDSDDPEEEDATLNEFLSRFVWIMRGKINDAYPDSDKQTVDAMLLVIVQKVASELEKNGIEKMLDSAAMSTASNDFSEDLWRTVWEVSHKVLEDMNKERKKEKMKKFLQNEEVKQMWRFAGEIGIKGDMLRELWFKWAREKMEESEFYESLERLREEERAAEKLEETGKEFECSGEGPHAGDEKAKVFELPKRHGKFKYKIYGLDLSDPKWAEIANRIHEREEAIYPQEPKPVSGKCKLIVEKILSLKEDEDPSPLLAEFVELLQPSRIDWDALLDRVREKNIHVYYKVAELVLTEKSFQTITRDYSRLIDAHVKENRLEDAERILKKMNENGIAPDVLTTTVLIRMYTRVGNLDRAKEAFDILESHGFNPDIEVYTSMIMAYVNANQPKKAESLMKKMQTRDIKPTYEIHLAVLRLFARKGDASAAARISSEMQFAGFQPNIETSTLLVEAYGQVGDTDEARRNFNHVITLGHQPDDRCTASMIAAYEKKNSLDKALNLLLELEKDGFQPGVATYTVLVDWLSKLQLVDEAEQLLDKIAEQGEAPPLKVNLSLCDMYSRVGNEKKALQLLGVLEARKEELSAEDFERIIKGLTAGGFAQEAKRIRGVMESLGYEVSDGLKVGLLASEGLARRRPIGGIRYS